MRALFRLFLLGAAIVACCGGSSIFYGWSEYKLGAKSTPEPIDVDLAKLEQGDKVDNNNLKLGKHYACYYSTVCSYKQGRFSSGNPTEKTKIDYAFYPIVSPANQDIQQLEQLMKKYPDLRNVPDDVTVPLPKHFVVLVKTTRYKTYGALPEGIQSVDSIQGLVINEVSSLSSDEKKLIQEEFPTIDFNKVLILEDGRQPSSKAKAITFMVMGAGILVVGLIGLIGVIVLFRGGKSASGG